MFISLHGIYRFCKEKGVRKVPRTCPKQKPKKTFRPISDLYEQGQNVRKIENDDDDVFSTNKQAIHSAKVCTSFLNKSFLSFPYTSARKAPFSYT